MFIRVSGAVFKTVISKVTASGKQTVVHFKLDNKMLYIQTADSIVDDLVIPATECDAEGVTEIAVYLDQTLNLLTDELVSLDMKEGMVVIRQGTFEYSAIALPEERIESNALTVDKVDALQRDNIISFVNAAKSLDYVAKTLLMEPSPIHIWNNRGYVYYSNTVLIDTLYLPNCSLPGELSRKLVSILTRSKGSAKYKFNEESGIMNIQVDKNEAISVAAQKVNLHIVQSVEDIISGLKDAAIVNMKDYSESMSVLCKVYKKMLIHLYICRNGIKLYVNNGRTKFDIGSEEQPLFSIIISTAQLSAIHRLFENDSRVAVKRGGNCLCLMNTNSQRTLIVSGMIC